MKYELIDDLVYIVKKKNPTREEIIFFKENYIPEIQNRYDCLLFKKAVDYEKFELADFIIEQGYKFTDPIHYELIEHFIQRSTNKIDYLFEKGYEIDENTNNEILSLDLSYDDLDYYNSTIRPQLIKPKLLKIKAKIKKDSDL